MSKLVDNAFFLILKIKFGSIFIIIFVLSAPKCVGIVSFNLIGFMSFSDVYPYL